MNIPALPCGSLPRVPALTFRDAMAPMSIMAKKTTKTAPKKEPKAKKEVKKDTKKETKKDTKKEKAAAPASTEFTRDLAVKALDEIVKFNNSREQKETKEQLWEDEDKLDDMVYVELVKKKYFSDKPQFKPVIIPVSHRVVPKDARVCLIIRDSAAEHVDTLTLVKVDEIVPVKVIKTDYKNFAKRREFLKSFDYFVVDSAVLNIMPLTLGKIFYKTTKYPVPIKFKEVDPVEINNALDVALQLTTYLPPMGTLVSIKVGNVNNAEQAADNIMDVAKTLTLDEYRSVLVKSRVSPALPLYYSEKAYHGEDEAEEVHVDNFEEKLLALGTAEDVQRAIGKKVKKQQEDEKKKSTVSTKDGKVAKN